MVLTIVLLAAAFVAILLVRQALAWWRFGGQRVIVCPETHAPAGVVVDARHAAATSILGEPELRLASCSRWPEKRDCGQECLSQIASAPEDCLVRNVVSNWYDDQPCAFCGSKFHDLDWASAVPALLQADGAEVEWNEVPADKLAETLAAAKPVCAACHLANRMVKEHPELVADRSAANAQGK
jgi:hypothetical protein